MKILVLNHNQERFGTYWRCFSLAEGLSKLGHQIVMVCASGKKFDLKVRKQIINKNFIIYSLPRIKLFRYFTGQFILRLPFYLYFVLTTKYDLLYAFTVAQAQIGIPAMLGKIIRKKKVIIDWDDLWGGGFADLHFNPIKKVLTFSETYFLKFADRITCASLKLYEIAQKEAPKDRVFYLPNGCDINRIKRSSFPFSRMKLKLDPEQKIILAMGNAYHLNVLKQLLSVYRLLLKKNPKLKIIFLSSLKLSEEIKNDFRDILDKITFTGFVSDQERDYYLSAADVLILPMEKNPIEEARSPIRFGDYLCAGRPIVSNAVGEVKHYLEKNKAGLICKTNSTSDFSKSIEKILSDEVLAEKLSKNALALAKKDLSEKKIIQEINKILLG